MILHQILYCFRLTWRKAPNGQHKIVIPQERHLFLITAAHNDIGHHGHFATHVLLSEQYWWPNMSQDIAWFIKTCHLCQIRKTQQINIPPIVAIPASLFAKVYMDMMHLPLSNGFKYIVQACCSLIHWPEWDMLRKETAKNIACFILFNLIYRWGIVFAGPVDATEKMTETRLNATGCNQTIGCGCPSADIFSVASLTV